MLTYALGFLYYVYMLCKLAYTLGRCPTNDEPDSVTYVGEAILTVRTPASQQSLLLLLTPFQSATQSIALSRLLLNMREAAEVNMLSSTELPSVGTWHARVTGVTSTQYPTQHEDHRASVRLTIRDGEASATTN